MDFFTEPAEAIYAAWFPPWSYWITCMIFHDFLYCVAIFVFPCYCVLQNWQFWCMPTFYRFKRFKDARLIDRLIIVQGLKFIVAICKKLKEMNINLYPKKRKWILIKLNCRIRLVIRNNFIFNFSDFLKNFKFFSKKN